MCYCLACNSDQVTARRASCAAEALGRYRGRYGGPKLHRGLAAGGGLLIALGVGVAVAGGVLYGKRDTPQFNPDPKVCDDLGQNPVCLWEYPTTIYGALLGGAAIGTGIWLLVKFGREHRVSLEIERKP